MTDGQAGKTRFSINLLSVLLTISVLSATALLVYLLPSQPPQPAPAHVVNYTTFDSEPQRNAHKVMLIMVAGCGLLALPLRRAAGVLFGAGVPRLSRAVAGLRCLPAWCLALLLPPAVLAYQGPGKDQFLLGIAVLLGVVLLSARLAQSRTARLLAVGALLAYAALLLLPGFYGVFTFGQNLDPSVLHYYGLFGLVPTLAQPLSDILSRTSIFYGLWPQTLLAALQHWKAPLHMGDYVLAVQLGQVAFTALGLASYRRIAPHAPVWSLFCMALWIPWIGTAGPSMLAPTSSGVRFFGLALGVFILLAGRNLPRLAQELALGATAGFALLNNLETGVCLTLGLLAYIVLGERAVRVARTLKGLLFFALGALLSGGAFCLFFRFGVGYWPATTAERMFAFLGNFSGGFAGLPLYFEVLLLPLLGYPIYLVIRLTGVWLARGVSERMRFKFSVAVIILVWFAYYFNRAHHWNLWSHMFLFTFLIVDLAPWRLPRDAAKPGGMAALLRAPIPLGTLALIFILGPAAANDGLTQSKVAWRSLTERIALKRTTEHDGVFSGIWVGEDCARDLRAKSAVLEEYGRVGSMVFASPNQFLLLLETGVVAPMTRQDIFNESFTEANYLRMLKELQSYAPDAVLLALETPCATTDPTRAAFNAVLEAQLASSYTRMKTATGWMVLRHR